MRESLIFAVLLAVFCVAGTAALPGGPGDDARERVDAWVAEKAGKESASRLPVTPIAGPALEGLLPDKLFFAAVARQYPVAMNPPAPFAVHNVLVYEKNGSVKHFPTPEELKSYFQRAAGTIQAQGEARRIVSAWLRLTQTFSEDGFFRFTIPDDQIKSSWQEAGALVVTGKALVVPKGGDSGEIVATLTFAGPRNGPRRLISITEKRDVKAGVRPICQATKLLDKDPIVRRMAEQDLLVMGRTAWPYVSEQREKASPELRREIDRVWKRILEERR